MSQERNMVVAVKNAARKRDLDVLVSVAEDRDAKFDLQQKARRLIDQIADADALLKLEKLLHEGHKSVVEPLVRLRSTRVAVYLLGDFRRRMFPETPGLQRVGLGYPAELLAELGHGAAPSLLRWVIEEQRFRLMTGAPVMDFEIPQAEKALARCKNDSLTCAVCSQERKVSAAQATRLLLRRSASSDAWVGGSFKGTQLCFSCGAFFCNDCLGTAFGRAVVSEEEACPKCGGYCTFL